MPCIHLLKICTYSDPSYEYKFYFFERLKLNHHPKDAIDLVKTLHYSTDTSLMEGIYLTDFKNTIFVEPFCGEYDLLNQLSS